MLVLQRHAHAARHDAGKSDLTLTLPDGRTVTVRVCRTDGAVVSVGIVAPADVQVTRGDARKTTPRDRT